MWVPKMGFSFFWALLFGTFLFWEWLFQNDIYPGWVFASPDNLKNFYPGREHLRKRQSLEEQIRKSPLAHQNFRLVALAPHFFANFDRSPKESLNLLVWVGCSYSDRPSSRFGRAGIILSANFLPENPSKLIWSPREMNVHFPRNLLVCPGVWGF